MSSPKQSTAELLEQAAKNVDTVSQKFGRTGCLGEFWSPRPSVSSIPVGRASLEMSLAEAERAKAQLKKDAEWQLRHAMQTAYPLQHVFVAIQPDKLRVAIDAAKEAGVAKTDIAAAEVALAEAKVKKASEDEAEARKALESLLSAEALEQRNAAEQQLREAMPGWFQTADLEELELAIDAARRAGVSEAIISAADAKLLEAKSKASPAHVPSVQAQARRISIDERLQAAVKAEGETALHRAGDATVRVTGEAGAARTRAWIEQQESATAKASAAEKCLQAFAGRKVLESAEKEHEHGHLERKHAEHEHGHAEKNAEHGHVHVDQKHRHHEHEHEHSGDCCGHDHHEHGHKEEHMPHGHAHRHAHGHEHVLGPATVPVPANMPPKKKAEHGHKAHVPPTLVGSVVDKSDVEKTFTVEIHRHRDGHFGLGLHDPAPDGPGFPYISTLIVKAGVILVGDCVTAVEGKPTTSRAAAVEAFRAVRGDVVRVQMLRLVKSTQPAATRLGAAAESDEYEYYD